MKSDAWHRTHTRSRHAHRPNRWAGAVEAISLIVVLFLIVIVVPLLWRP